MDALNFHAICALLIFAQIGRASDPLDPWTSRGSQPADLPLYGIAYGGGKFVAVGNGGVILTSADDGMTWVRRESGTTNMLRGVTYGSGQFAVVGFEYSERNALGEVHPMDSFSVVLTSADGASWVERWSGKQTELREIAYGNGRFLAAGHAYASGSLPGASVTSADGVNWVQHSGIQRSLHSIAFGNGQFVATSLGGTIAISADGANWPEQQSGSGIVCQCSWVTPIAFGNGRFVTLGTVFTAQKTNYEISGTSTDGLNWIAHQATFQGFEPGAPEFGPLRIAFGNGQFVAVGSSTPGPPTGRGIIQTSVDGLAWRRRKQSTRSPLEGIAFGNGRFVAVSSGGEILQSGPIINLSIALGTDLSPATLLLEGPTGLSYTIQSSSDLISWRDVARITGAQSSKVILDGGPALSDRQFYRATSN